MTRIIECSECGEQRPVEAFGMCRSCYAKKRRRDASILQWSHEQHHDTGSGAYLPPIRRTPAGATRCARCQILIAPNRMFNRSYDGMCRWCYDEQQRKAA